jgi:hypothetical protein
MKGIIFREFIDMVETRFGYEMVDEFLENTKLNSKGIYTAVGTYHHSEIFTLAEQLSANTNIPVSQLFFLFGKHAFGVFSKTHSKLFTNFNDPFGFLENVESNIHVEVQKLYPDAELPSFTIESRTDNDLVMIYTSNRKMADFAKGLIIGCFEYFNVEANIETKILKDDKSIVKFVITKKK